MPAVALNNTNFLHIPKTGGTSIGHWMMENGGPQLGHWYLHPRLTEIQGVAGKKFSFTVVRNPWDRLVSLYHFSRDWRNPAPYGNAVAGAELQATLDRIKQQTFAQWLQGIETAPGLPNIWFNGLTNQVDWMDEPVDLILKFETLETDFQQIQDRLNCQVPLRHELSTVHGPYQDYYTTETQALVARLYARDIAAFNYTF